MSIIMSPSITLFLWSSSQQLPDMSILKLLITCFIINHLLFFNFIQAFCTYRAIYNKRNLFILDNGIFDGFLKIFRQWISKEIYLTILLLLTSSTMLIYLFCNHVIFFATRLQKSFFSVHVCFYTSKYPSSSESLNMLHCWLSALVYLHSSNIYQGMVVFTLLVYRVNL